ncbi:hypothetical protein PVAND_008137 [Polypedilum vanderplanki]|uniref:Acyltransferase n=1 Tax=Polypedilum vanderplanki TaxID=319348 RepID=A0A9J6C9M4_POLVA|nr:hypothetical protein PVAND_008137 [Polypedilum vanderplanki]
MNEDKISFLRKHVVIINYVRSFLKSIKFAPINVPFNQRCEVFSAFLFISMVLFAEALCVLIIYFLLFHGGLVGQIFCIGYFAFMISDIKADETGIRGQGSKWVRSWKWWKYYANYFPVKLIKTVDLPPNKNYLFGCFPHAIIGCGLFANFATNATGFNENFPGIRSKMCTLSFHFYVPFFRELAFSWGLMSAKYVSIKQALSQSTNPLAVANQADKFTSNAVVLVVGGAQEALMSHPGKYEIFIKSRKGFIKIALETGASLVPVFSFGETEVYDQTPNEPGSKVRRFQEAFKKWTGVAPAIFIGRGFFQYSFGLIPRRAPIHTIVGAPIAVEKILSPSKEDIDNLHQKFIEELEKLFEEHKRKYIPNAENVKLIMR